LRWEHRHSNGGRAARTQLARTRRRQTRRRFSPAETKTLTVVRPIDLAENVEARASINELTIDQQIPRLPEHALGQRTGNNDANPRLERFRVAYLRTRAISAEGKRCGWPPTPSHVTVCADHRRSTHITRWLPHPRVGAIAPAVPPSFRFFWPCGQGQPSQPRPYIGL